MKQQVTNFGRFYSAFHRLIIHGEAEEAKRQFVLQYTAGRTDSLKEMTRKEYTDLCRHHRLGADKRLLPASTNFRQSLRAAVDRRTHGARHPAPHHKAQGVAAPKRRRGTGSGEPEAARDVSCELCPQRHDKLKQKQFTF